MLIFRQLFDPTSSTYSYLLADGDSGEAVLIDPVFEQVRRDAALVRELGLTLRWTLETHVHADHVTSAWLLHQRLGSGIALGARSGVQGATRLLGDGDIVAFGTRSLTALPTPGHTDGCTSYVLDDRRMAFTGDTLLVRGSGRTDFQQGSATALYHSVRDRLFALPGHCLLYPAHDYRGLTVTSVSEEQRFNPRLGGDASEGDFVGYMANLHLPHPKQLDVAVPANLLCGRPQAEQAAGTEPAWGPVAMSFGGVWEIQPLALAEIAARVQLLDVREPEEFDGPLGHIEGARLLPLGQLQAGLGALDRGRPVVTVCRSGARSAQAAVLLGKAGFAEVANLSGGMLRWHAERGRVSGAAAAG